MDVIPVLDIARGHVVRGVKGDRASYRPIVSPLVSGSAPGAVAEALLRLSAFRTLYIADLDGIEGRGRNTTVVADILRQSSTGAGVEIWLDAGVAQVDDARKCLGDPRVTVVVGSESVTSIDAVRELVAVAGERVVLSLDFRGHDFLGASEILTDPTCWPARVIVMTLARVGSGEGPDLARCADVIRRAGPTRQVYAAGGVRDRADLLALRHVGAAGVLVASALHSGAIAQRDLEELGGVATASAGSDTLP